MSRVLVAEDDPEMRRLVVETLRKDGHQVIEAVDGGDMLVRLAKAFDGVSMPTIDVVVSDVRMPVRSGLDVVELLLATRRRPPCILMTAFGDEEVRERAQAAGVSLLLHKPLNLDDLRQAVRRLGHR